ncbi:MAG: tRNA lysidine(34) synthetase TilS [Brumimicrobium sp.]|nr:tRNA lysidine(34) synthetase TilS [Brumimicrobium sp.]MCO5269158.1 tRNA lysidine(34) synthetase TilS [Brumimicrobium sp.]
MDTSPTYWLACSGGLDSVVLAHLLKESQQSFGILHCNFHLRGEDSNLDQKFVEQLAIELNVPIRIKEFDTFQYMKSHQMNLELAARELRYNWFEEIIEIEKTYIILAHHKNDQIETFFTQLRRGGKVRGLAGMPVYRDGFIRPLLKYSKEELKSLASRYHWAWREDKSNESNEYVRNLYRNKLLHLIEKQGFPIVDVIPLMHDFQHLLSYLNTLPKPNSWKLNEWQNLPIWFKQHLLTHYKVSEFPTEEVDKLLHSEKGKYIGNQETSIWNEGNVLIFVSNKIEDSQKQIKIEEVKIPDFTLLNCIYIDADKVAMPLDARKWKEGDLFQPYGMKGVKTVAKFLRDKKIPSHQKENYWVLEDNTSRIIGIFGFGAGELFKIDKNSQTIWQINLVDK